jgi:hypothetical protein
MPNRLCFTHLSRVFRITRYRMCFACTSLAVRNNASIVTLHRRIIDREGALLKDVTLSRAFIENAFEHESMLF